MKDCCSKCGKQFTSGEGGYNYPDGIQCGKCGDNYTGWKKETRKERPVENIQQELQESMRSGATTIGTHIIPNKLLDNYKDHVEYLKRSITISIGRDDPLIIQKALKQREKIHREIFKHAGLIYHADSNSNIESIKFNELLDAWLTEKIGVEI